MSPSTVMRLKLDATASASAARSGESAITASVVMKLSIVACRPARPPRAGTAAGRRPLALMPGWIMPAPFAMPPTRTRILPSANSYAVCFMRVSLVMIASMGAAAYSLDADPDRGRAHLVGREHAGDGGGGVGYDQRQVPLVAFLGSGAGAEALDVAEHSGRQEAARRQIESSIETHLDIESSS